MRSVRRGRANEVFLLRRARRAVDAADDRDGHGALGTVRVVREQRQRDLHLVQRVRVRPVSRRDGVAAILRVGDRFVLQHRDNKPDIDLPGLWSLFGGELETDEAPAAGIRREIVEELALQVDDFERLWIIDEYRVKNDDWIPVTIFTADVTAQWPAHRLGEGQGVALFPANGLPAAMSPVARDLIERYLHERGKP
jgi:8-oxo-dGTP pyrophosphatase MutT (NUDIX family)